MTDPVITFEDCRSGSREIAKLGALEIGFVIERPNGNGRVQSLWKAQFGVNASIEFKQATSRPMAKRALVYRMAELFECAGPSFALIASQTRSQADTMERA